MVTAVKAYIISTIVDPLMWTALQLHGEMGVCAFSGLTDLKQITV